MVSDCHCPTQTGEEGADTNALFTVSSGCIELYSEQRELLDMKQDWKVIFPPDKK
jgi:hypothetical protein